MWWLLAIGLLRPTACEQRAGCPEALAQALCPDAATCTFLEQQVRVTLLRTQLLTLRSIVSQERDQWAWEAVQPYWDLQVSAIAATIQREPTALQARLVTEVLIPLQFPITNRPTAVQAVAEAHQGLRRAWSQQRRERRRP